VLVIVSYLLYTVYEVDWNVQREGDFYRDLGVPFDVGERRLQSHFRKLCVPLPIRRFCKSRPNWKCSRTLHYHPDKISNPTPERLARADAHFVRLKLARDTLLSPARRFAYERFGPLALDACKTCATKLEFVQAGLMRMVPFYLAIAGSLMAVSYFGYVEYGRYVSPALLSEGRVADVGPQWQYFTIACMFAFELHTITRPTMPFARLAPLLTLVRGAPYLPYQAIAVARRVALACFVAVAQIAPRLAAGAGPASPASVRDDDVRARDAVLARLLAAAREADADAVRLLRLEAVPFAGRDDDGLAERFRGRLASWLVGNEIDSDPGVQEAVRRAVERRNEARRMEESVVIDGEEAGLGGA
jgi:hypothetical protein